MEKVHNNDISIDRDKWISWIELDLSKTPLNIDAFLQPTIPFWKILETECFSACCGVHAFGLWPDDIKNASQRLNDDLIKIKFATLRTDLSRQTDLIFTCSFLNNLFDKRVFIQILDHIIANL
jgi:hypothetical protein